jgi:hypothetical protein
VSEHNGNRACCVAKTFNHGDRIATDEYGSSQGLWYAIDAWMTAYTGIAGNDPATARDAVRRNLL